MVNDLRSLLHESSELAPYDEFDTSTILRAGRSRTRKRRATVIGAAGLAAAAVIGSAVALGGLAEDQTDRRSPSSDSSEPVGKVLHLEDATAVKLEPVFRSVYKGGYGADYRFVDGVTDDGQVIVRENSGDPELSRLKLVDLATKAETPLPDVPGRVGPVLEASSERVVYSADVDASGQGGSWDLEARALVLDRATATWRTLRWSDLPTGWILGRDIGPDGRLYLAIAPDVDDPIFSNTGKLFSVSLTDPTDVRDEDLVVGNFAIDDDHLVWSELTQTINNKLTVRNLDTGDQLSFDPKSGPCMQATLGLEAGHIVMSQYCGNQDGVTDDRVQVVTTDGEPVVTIQDDEIQGTVDNGGHLVITAKGQGGEGFYSYDLDSGDFIRLSTSTSSLWSSASVPEGYLAWAEEWPDSPMGWVQSVAEAP